MTDDQQAPPAEQAQPARKKFGLELVGDRLVCTCHGRTVITLNPDALAEWKRGHDAR